MFRDEDFDVSMKYHVISVRSSFINAPIRAIHVAFFHGKASRGGDFPSAMDARLAYDVDIPLRLHKNAFEIADVIAPGLEMVVSHRVADRLVDIPSVELRPVQFTVLYDYPYEVGDLSCGFEHYDDQMQFIDGQADVAELHDRVGTFFQLVAPPLHEIRRRYPRSPEATITIDDDPRSVPVSSEVLRTNPLYSLGGSKILSDEMFEILFPFIDLTYFTYSSAEVENGD